MIPVRCCTGNKKLFGSREWRCLPGIAWTVTDGSDGQLHRATCSSANQMCWRVRKKLQQQTLQRAARRCLKSVVAELRHTSSACCASCAEIKRLANRDCSQTLHIKSSICVAHIPNIPLVSTLKICQSGMPGMSNWEAHLGSSGCAVTELHHELSAFNTSDAF